MKVINYRTLTQQRLAIEEEALAEAARSESAITTVDDLIEINSPDVELEEGLDRIAQEADDAFDGIVVLQNIVEANDRIEGEPNEVEMRMARVAMESALYKLGMEDELDEKKGHAGMIAKIKSYITRGVEIIIATLKRIKDWFVDFYDMLFGEAKSLIAKIEKLDERFKKVHGVWAEHEGEDLTRVFKGAGELMNVGLLNHEINTDKVLAAIKAIAETGKNYQEIAQLIPGLGGAVAEGDGDTVKTFVTKIGKLATSGAEKFIPRFGRDLRDYGVNLKHTEYRGYELVGPAFVYFPELDDESIAKIKKYTDRAAEKDVTEGRVENAEVHEGIEILRKFAIRSQSKFNAVGRHVMSTAAVSGTVMKGSLVNGLIDLIDKAARSLVGSRGAGREATKAADKLLAEAQKQRAQLSREVDKDDEALKAMNGRVNNLVAFNNTVTYMLFQSVRDLDTASISIVKALYRLVNLSVVSVEKLSAKAA